MRMLRSALLLLSCAALGSSKIRRARDYTGRDYYVFEIQSSTDIKYLEDSLGMEHEEPLGEIENHHVFSKEKHEGDAVKNHRRHLRVVKRDLEAAEYFDNAITWYQKQTTKMLHKRELPPRQHSEGEPNEGKGHKIEVTPADYLRQMSEQLGIRDPIFKDQWHLHNPLQQGHDVNVTGLWLEGITGKNATVAIVDDGLDMYSNDLKDNYFAEGSWDYNDPGPEPKPRLFDDKHGTRCAGEVAAAKNDVCGVGVAYDAKVAGIRILSKQISDSDEAIALNYKYQKNQIYSCSWGPPDDGQAMDAPGILIKKAMVQGIQKGRDGKGSLFVFASGNGANNGDNCNFDGYTNSIYSITVAAIDRTGSHPYYSESCSANMIVTYSSGSGDAIHTTDVGENACYSGHGGTSAAAPLAAGVFALVFQVRPDLSWRDMQYLCVDTAIPVNTDDRDWQTTTIGKKYNHMYGYGKLDAYRLVEAAKDFKSVKPQAWYHSAIYKINHDIPNGDYGLHTNIEIKKEDLANANVERLEHVTVTMNLNHTCRGDLSVDLISPQGIISKIAVRRNRDKSTEGYQDWTFMSVKHWGEDGIGKWTLIVKDKVNPEHNGTLIDWQLNLWGESIDGKKQELHPMPGAKHDPYPIIEGKAFTAPAEEHTDTPTLVPNPTDHPHRPVNAKPSSKPAEPTTVQDVPTSASGQPTGVPKVGSGSEKETQKPEEEKDHASYLPSFFPTFGVSAIAQGWIYGAVAGIAIFVAVVGIYLCVQKRKREKKTSREAYEFAMLEDEADLEAAEKLTGGGAKRAGKAKKGRDLYDAFGESDEEDGLRHHTVGSDSEDEDDDDESGDEAIESYRDDVPTPKNKSPERGGGSGGRGRLLAGSSS